MHANWIIHETNGKMRFTFTKRTFVFLFFFCCFWKLLEFKHLTRTTIHLECVVCARALVFGWMRCFCLKSQVLYIDFIYARRILFTRKGTLHQFIKFTNQYYDATIQIGIYNSCDTRVMWEWLLKILQMEMTPFDYTHHDQNFFDNKYVQFPISY